MGRLEEYWSAGRQMDELLSRSHQLIAAFCPTCGGWVMFCTTESDNARLWTQSCYVAGELVIGMRTTIGLGPECPQADTPIPERTCDL